MKLFVKSWCPWCIRAREFLDQRGYRYQTVDVLDDRTAYDEMIQLSGQRYTPTLLAGDKLLADFGPEELDAFLKKHTIEPPGSSA